VNERDLTPEPQVGGEVESSDKVVFGPERPPNYFTEKGTESSNRNGTRQSRTLDAEDRQSHSNPPLDQDLDQMQEGNVNQQEAYQHRGHARGHSIQHYHHDHHQSYTREQYEGEIQHQYDKRREAEVQLESALLRIRELEKIERNFHNLQTEKIQSVDRFQPKFDSDITNILKDIDANKMKKLVIFLGKTSNDLGPEALSAAFQPHLWVSPHYKDSIAVDFKEKEFRNRLLKSVIWKFLQDNLFLRPFMCFGGDRGERADMLYSAIYPDPRKLIPIMRN
jgi:hypothetical protein